MRYFRFQKLYFFIAILLLLTEIYIAINVNDEIIRPYGGDFLVVILIFAAWKSLFDTPLWPTAIGVLLFSYFVEATQYFHLLKHIGWEHNRMARIILGNSFAWTDIFAYTAGILLVIIVEKIRERKG